MKLEKKQKRVDLSKRKLAISRERMKWKEYGRVVEEFYELFPKRVERITTEKGLRTGDEYLYDVALNFQGFKLEVLFENLYHGPVIIPRNILREKKVKLSKDNIGFFKKINRKLRLMPERIPDYNIDAEAVMSFLSLSTNALGQRIDYEWNKRFGCSVDYIFKYLTKVGLPDGEFYSNVYYEAIYSSLITKESSSSPSDHITIHKVIIPCDDFKKEYVVKIPFIPTKSELSDCLNIRYRGAVDSCSKMANKAYYSMFYFPEKCISLCQSKYTGTDPNELPKRLAEERSDYFSSKVEIGKSESSLNYNIYFQRGKNEKNSKPKLVIRAI